MKIRALWLSLLLLCLSLFLSGCATLTSPNNQPPLTEQQRQAKLAGLNSWQITGAIGGRSSQGGWNANYLWQQTGSHYQIELAGPLGAGATRISGSPSNVVMQTAKGQRLQARSAQALIKNQMGWDIPIANLVYWIRGLPAPGRVGRSMYDAKQHLAILDQAGWHIVFENYFRTAGIDLPSKLTLTYRDLRVRIIVRRWNIG